MDALFARETSLPVRSGYHRVQADESLSLDSDRFPVQPNQVYEAKAWVVGYEGAPGCALLAFIFFDEGGKEIGRKVVTMEEFSGQAREYRIQTESPPGAAKAAIAYRVNAELPEGACPAKCYFLLTNPCWQKVERGGEKPKPKPFEPETTNPWAEVKDSLKGGPGPNIPIPPLELRELTGLSELSFYDNPSGELLWPHIPGEMYEWVFDFGCGCGRVARQLMQQHKPPRSYLGLDINHSMIEWCDRNLTPINPAFRFEHHDVYNITYAPSNSKNRVLPIPAPDSSFSLTIAISVFTHLLQDQTEFYLKELCRTLRPEGQIVSTWFFFYREDFPVLADHQNCLFVNESDPTQAVYYDYNYFLRLVQATGLQLVSVIPPRVKNFHWEVWLQHGKG